MAIVMLPTLCVAQESWLYAWRTQPSGEFAPDHRKTDPFQPMYSDAELESQAARKAPSFLTQFASNVNSSALQDADDASIPELPAGDAFTDDAATDYESDPAMPADPTSALDSTGYSHLDELMPQTAPASPITPQQELIANV